jgi:8-oxo-dGTP pyrophosphatase MutT (NUDIX family)
MKLKKDLQYYQVKNKQEKTDKQAMLTFIERNEDCLLRDNLVGHFTSSAIIVNSDSTKVLFIHHNIYNSWAWVGGHNDGDDDSLHVALKEAKEETGLSTLDIVSKDIAGIDTIYVMSHIKNGVFVSDHLHFNITYIFKADETASVSIKPDENSGVRWFDIHELDHVVDESRMKPIYKKLLDVAKSYQ